MVRDKGRMTCDKMKWEPVKDPVAIVIDFCCFAHCSKTRRKQDLIFLS
jgi:hypothetical protein